MSPQGIVFIPLSGPDSVRLRLADTVSGAPSDPLRARILSYNRVSEQLAELLCRRFSGRLVLRFEAGRVVWAKVEESEEE